MELVALGCSQRTGTVTDDFDVLSIWVWSFDEFVVSEDLEMRPAE